MTRSYVVNTAASVAAVLFAFGCHHAVPAATPAPPAPAPAPAPPVANDSADRAEAARLAAARADSVRRADAARAAAAAAREALTQPLHFDFDQSEVLDSERSLVDRKADVLKANPQVRLRIDGNADERGSDEYNVALGMRRATATRRWLADRGIDESRIETMSNGEERPVCSGHDESCWAQNRRAEFVITAGGENIVAPPR